MIWKGFLIPALVWSACATVSHRHDPRVQTPCALTQQAIDAAEWYATRDPRCSAFFRDECRTPIEELLPFLTYRVVKVVEEDEGVCAAAIVEKNLILINEHCLLGVLDDTMTRVLVHELGHMACEPEHSGRVAEIACFGSSKSESP